MTDIEINFEINYDMRPYLPDIFINQNIYNSCDSVDNNNNIDINTTIFLINIDEPIDSIYNDPLYMLYGKKKDGEVYIYPSLNFYHFNDISLNTDYQVIYKTNEINNEIVNILNLIGYNILNINETQFEYQLLETNESLTKLKYKILYFYFNLKNYKEDQTEVNYNEYETSTYYNNKIYNVLIYPYYKKTKEIKSLDIPNNYDNFVEDNNLLKSIKTINFDNREIIKYYEKIDYKYFENIKFTMNPNTNLETLKNYSYNIKNYIEYINQNNNLNKNIINISLNEISKMFYYSIEYNTKCENTYTSIYLNNNHINNNISFSNQNNRYSYSMDKKIANINLYDSELKKYSSYYNENNTFNSTLYQQTVNYYLNFYYNINNINSQYQIINLYLYLLKIFIFINPKIIDLDYLLNNITTSIYPLFIDSNILQFGQDNNKLQLYLIGSVKETEIYYINKYKIIFEYKDYNDKINSFIIILNIAFYNGNYFNILDITSTTTTPLAYINYTSIEESVSILPTIYTFQSKNRIYNQMNSFNIKNIKNYYYNINYLNKDQYSYLNNYISSYNFFDIIPNIITNLKTSDNNYYNNVINVLKSKINNFIINFINIEENYYNFIQNINKIKKYINLTTLYDENIITTDNTIKYIEYISYFPEIKDIYITLAENYVGKYNKVLVYPNNNLNISSFEILPAGRYIKFNYINYLSYPTPNPININFIQSLKFISEFENYYFSLYILLPLNINQDDEFYCSNSKEFWNNNSNYSMNIGDNKTNIYLVLTDKENKPYNFYGETDINGIIYGIKLYNYNNFISDNLKLPIILNLYMNKYMNLSQFVILIESFSNYSDESNVLWDINQSYLKLHNFDSLKEIILYDYKRFNNSNDINNIKEQYNKFNYKTLQILYENKNQLNNLRYDIKILIYVSNLYKIIKLIQKINAYCEIIKINIIIKDYNNDYIINLVKYNSGLVSNLFDINYNLSITSGVFESLIYKNISEIYKIDINNTLENINNYQSYCVYIINYSINKLPSIINSMINNVSNIKNIYHNIYYEIYKLVIVENINYLIGEQIINDIDNFTNSTSISIFDEIINLEIPKRPLLLKQINAYLKSIAYNTTKIDELYNLAKLMGDNYINIELPENLDNKTVKNNYIYNTTCYEDETQIPRFKICEFLNDTKELINKLSSPINNITEYEIYKKSILEGIKTNIDNTKIYFEDIINKIINIYNKSIDINNELEIANFYNLLGLFKNNYTSFFTILYQNNINKFYEYDNLKTAFDNLFYSCEEFLFYISLKKDFVKYYNYYPYSPYSLPQDNIFINEDLYKIIKTNEFNDFTIKTIENIDNLVIIKKPDLTIIYLEKIKSFFVNKSEIYLNESTIKIIDEMIFELSNDIIINNTTPNNFINYGSYYIIPYQDLLLFKGTFNWASFNFKQQVIDVINNINSLNKSIFTTYYNNETNDFYKQALNYTYLNTPYKYININNIKI
jgi:hypothetical protein